MKKNNRFSNKIKGLGRRVLSLPFIVIALPCVLLIRCLRFLRVVRLARVDSSNFAHLWSPELYLCEQDLNLQPKGVIDIFYSTTPVANKYLFKKWKKLIHIFGNSMFFTAVDAVNRKFPGFEAHVVTLNSLPTNDENVFNDNKRLMGRRTTFVFHQNAGWSLLRQTQPHVLFTKEEEAEGQRFLRELNISEGSEYICFHARDNAYKDNLNAEEDWSYHDFRDANIEDYLPMVKELIARGIYGIRMGSKVAHALKTDDPMIIDYASQHHSQFMDFYLGAHCRFFVTSMTGINIIPTLFRRPGVQVNVIPHYPQHSWTKHDLMIFKNVWLRSEKRFLKFREILSSEMWRYSYSWQYERDGVEVIENTPEEITAVVLEMDARLNGTWEATEESEELQRRFWEILNPKIIESRLAPDIGTEFLRQHRGLLD